MKNIILKLKIVLIFKSIALRYESAMKNGLLKRIPKNSPYIDYIQEMNMKILLILFQLKL